MFEIFFLAIISTMPTALVLFLNQHMKMRVTKVEKISKLKN